MLKKPGVAKDYGRSRHGGDEEFHSLLMLRNGKGDGHGVMGDRVSGEGSTVDGGDGNRL